MLDHKSSQSTFLGHPSTLLLVQLVIQFNSISDFLVNWISSIIALAKVVGTFRQVVPVSTPLQQVLAPLWKRLFAAEAVIAPDRPTDQPHRKDPTLLLSCSDTREA